MNIFVGNLAFTATEAEVRQLFEGYGTVDTVCLQLFWGHRQMTVGLILTARGAKPLSHER
jgi:RNA recognition motif-containing protein